MGRAETCDVAIVGGGLAGCLIAYALTVKRPELTVRLIEADATLGGNHVWSFFSTDVTPANRWIVDPFVQHQWLGYDIRFPALRRALGSQYNSIRSQAFDITVRSLLPPDTVVCARARQLMPTAVILENGQTLRARGVIDARGPAHLNLLDAGWQKFVGQEYRTARPHGLTQPIVMDATVDQIDGFRFVYVLPLSADRIFVEDTYYSDSPKLNVQAVRQRLTAYTDAQGWQVAEVCHEENGVLPVVLGGNFEAFWAAGAKGVAKVGARAALFHPTTGFSLPDAVRTAALIAALPDVSGPALHDAMYAHARTTWNERGFYRMLDRMLFRTIAPDQRYRIMQRFYGLRPRLIERFYAGSTSMLDKLRILTGKPPVPILEAMKVVREKK
ncbi:MAG: lycopene beta-cyclase CrtY [Sphingomonadaceae bacterium]